MTVHSSIRIIRCRIDLARWRQRTPSVDKVRPAVCVVCGVASRPAGGPLCVYGHGLRERQVRGPEAPCEAPRDRTIDARRYQCQRCPTIMIVVPREVAPRRHYAATAIALALVLYGLCERSHAEVRGVVSGDAVVGVRAERRWHTLGRWIDAVAERRLFPSLPAMPVGQGRRAVAARAAMAIGAHAPPSLGEGALERRAFAGGARMP